MPDPSGKRAEEDVAEFLRQHEFNIRARNWRKSRYEVDLIAEKEHKIHFVEVKFRQDRHFGAGYEYVTTAKLERLRLAALEWTADNDWRGDYCIDIASIDGASGEIDYIEDIVLA